MQNLYRAISDRKLPIRCFVDGPSDNNTDITKVDEVKKVALEYKEKFYDFKIISANKNRGLAKSIISGVDSILKKYNSAIVLEDDILIHPNCIEYFEFFLNKFSDDQDIFSISAYNPANHEKLVDYEFDIFSTLRMQCWGWATWKSRWLKVDWNVENFNKILNDKYILEKYEKEVVLIVYKDSSNGS